MTLDQLRTLFLAGGLLSLGCGGGVAPSEPAASGPGVDLMAMTIADRFAARDRERDERRFSIVPRNAPVAGKTTLEWIPEWWRYVMSQPADVNPVLNASVDCSVGQSGPVFLLPTVQGPGFTRRCTIPAQTPVLWTFQSLFNDYPCPDPTFQPAPGQTLEEFLAEGAKAFDDRLTNMTASIDGTALDPDRYRYLTGLFSFTGDPSLTATFDSCVTGSEQVAVADGWFVLVRLSPGDHTLVSSYVNSRGHLGVATFLLHVLGDDDD